MRNTSSNGVPALFPFMLSSVMITLLLFFIDEGHYNFAWMANWVNWVIFIVYVIPVFFTQVLFSRVILSKNKGFGNTLVSILIGSITGLTFVVGMVYSLG